MCPIYKAGENIKLRFNYLKFVKEIIKNSKVELIIINGEKELAKFAKKNIYGNKIVIGMGVEHIKLDQKFTKIYKMKLDDLEKLNF